MLHVGRIVQGNAKTFSLTDGVVLDSPVLPQNVTVQVDYVAGNAGFVVKKHFKIFRRNKVLAFFPVCGFNVCLPGQFKNFFFLHEGKWEPYLFQKFRRQPVKKICLVFCSVSRSGNHGRALFSSKNSLFRPDYSGVVTGAEIVKIDFKVFNSCQKGIEFYKAVAADAGIWSPSCPVFAFKIFKDDFSVCFLYVDNVVFNALFFAEFFTFGNVFFFPGAVAGFPYRFFRFYLRKLSVPDGHGGSYYLATLLFKQKGRQGGIHSAGHSHNYGVSGFRHIKIYIIHKGSKYVTGTSRFFSGQIQCWSDFFSCKFRKSP